MASGNFLTAKTHLSELKTTSDKDTISEASESGTSNSVTSSEDLQKLAVILGLNSLEDVYQEKFRVDRRRLETMLSDNLEESQTAQAFFNRVMNETNTLINWPARLKIGARSKKDPHVRIAGRADDVKLAREKIMQLLDTRSNRVTMKIDVSYTDHSHIIGKGGLTIKRVMEETGCHIHFPDSNRTSAMEKSNQVSIAGDMERVERARARVRALTPLVFCFELPIVHSSQPLPDITSPYVQQIQEQYKVQVMLRNRPKLHANLVVVKGVQWEVQATMEATTLLMNYMCGPLASQTKVQMTLEISPMHHSIVVGYNCGQLTAITRGTGAQVMFPDASDPNTPPIKKSCVTISGHINDVYKARQQLVGSLPLVVIFDVSDEICRVEPEMATRLMHKYDVFINIRHKPKQGITSVVVRGIERCAGDIYEARRELLGGKEPSITAEIPESYQIPSLSSGAGAAPVFPPFTPHSPCSPFAAAAQEMASYAMNSPIFNNQPTHGGFASPVSPAVFPPWAMPSPPPHHAPFPFPAAPPHPHSQMYAPHTSWNPMSSTVDMQPQPMHGPPFPHHVEPTPTNMLSQILNASSQASSSGYQSNFTGSCMSLDTQNISGENVSNVGSPSVSPISAAHSSHSPHAAHRSSATNTEHEGEEEAAAAAVAANPLHQCTVNVSQISKAHSPQTAHRNSTQKAGELANIMAELPLSDRRAPGCEKKTLETLNKLSPLSDYRKMKAEASKAMRENVGSGYRVPTPRWSGYYFSHTSPGPLNLKSETATAEALVTPEKPWNRAERRAELTRPNIVESVATPPRQPPPPPPPPTTPRPCRYQQLYDLLRDVGLHKYIELFKEHELDMSTFASLSAADLVELGVTAFGARRKMLLLIADLQKQRGQYSSPSAAERKVVNSPPYNTAALAQDKW